MKSLTTLTELFLPEKTPSKVEEMLHSEQFQRSITNFNGQVTNKNKIKKIKIFRNFENKSVNKQHK